MLNSMTAFARKTINNADGQLILEIRSVNHRYLEIGLKLPDSLRIIEMPLRDLLRQKLSRGKVDCSLKFQTNDTAAPAFKINQPMLDQISNALETLKQSFHGALEVQAMDVLTYPGVLLQAEMDLEILKTQAIDLFSAGMDDLIAMRIREGEQLKNFVAHRLKDLQKIILQIKSRLPEMQNLQRSKLNEKLAELKLELNPERLEQELLLLYQKTDVSEEIDRLTAHIDEFFQTIKIGGVVGRRLDFLCQELHREANTLSAKSTDIELAKAGIDLKVLVEQIREQIQNIE